jgi:hypothetical protein
MKLFLLLFVTTIFCANADPLPTQPAHPSFQLNAKAKRVLVEKAKSVKLGDSYQVVIKKLGTPTFDMKLARKESSRVIGRDLDYYAVIWEDGLVNEKKDELVNVFLDENDRVKSVHIRVKLE